jgi:hypothetical protein
MPGMIVIIMQYLEETFLNVDLLRDEEFIIPQTRSDLFLNIFDGHAGGIGENRFAVLFVIAGIAI